MLRILVAILLLMGMTNTTIFASPADNYHGIAVQRWSLALQEFDTNASKPGSSDFVKINESGRFPSWGILAPAMKAGWDVSFNEQGIKTGALLIFGNREKDNSILAIVTRNDEGLSLKWYTKDNLPQTQIFRSIAEAEQQLDYRFIGAINPLKNRQLNRSSIGVGDKIPSFYLDALDNLIRLEEQQKMAISKFDKITVLHYWATWCPHCVNELPQINRFAQKYHDEINFYAINAHEDFDIVKHFIHSNGYNFQVLWDKGAVAGFLQIEFLPTTIIIDKDGTIKYRTTGEVTLSDLENAINKIKVTHR